MAPDAANQGSAPQDAPQGADAQPKRLGGFELLGRLGKGGMGTVLKARQVSMDRLVALKILPKKLAENDTFVQRFLREARSAAKLRHPNIVQAHDVGVVDGYYFFAMEFVDGETLADLVRRDGPLEPNRALDVMKQVTSALAAAHKEGIVHRDIKPSNIMIDKEGQVRVADFGLAKRMESDVAVTADGSVVGTPAYVAPEMAKGGEAEARSDLYSLGATIFCALAGRPPFEGRNFSEVLIKQANEPAPPLASLAPRVDRRLCHVIDRLLRKNPESRHPSAKALLDDLNGLGKLQSVAAAARAEGRALIAEAPTLEVTEGQRTAREVRGPRPTASGRRPTTLVAVGAIVAIIAVVGIVMATRGPKYAATTPPSSVPENRQPKTENLTAVAAKPPSDAKKTEPIAPKVVDVPKKTPPVEAVDDAEAKRKAAEVAEAERVATGKEEAAEKARLEAEELRRQAEAAAAAYATESDKLWALFKARDYAAADKLLAAVVGGASVPRVPPRAGDGPPTMQDMMKADLEAAKLLKEFWATVEKGVAARKGTISVEGALGNVAGVEDGVITLQTAKGPVTRRIEQLTAKQALAYAAVAPKDDERSHLAEAIFRIAEAEDAVLADKALAAAGNPPGLTVYKDRLAALTLGAAEVAARKAWAEIEALAKEKLTKASATKLLVLLDDFAAKHGRSKVSAEYEKDAAALRERANELQADVVAGPQYFHCKVVRMPQGRVGFRYDWSDPAQLRDWSPCDGCDPKLVGKEVRFGGDNNKALELSTDFKGDIDIMATYRLLSEGAGNEPSATLKICHGPDRGYALQIGTGVQKLWIGSKRIEWGHAPCPKDRVNTARIVRKGDSLSVWLDGKLAIQSSDADFKDGRVRLCSWNANVAYGEVVVVGTIDQEWLAAHPDAIKQLGAKVQPPDDQPMPGEWQSLFDGKTLKGWQPVSLVGGGPKPTDVQVLDGSLAIDARPDWVGMVRAGEFPKDNYEVSFDAKRLTGQANFCLMAFPVGGSHCRLIVGDWGGQVLGLGLIDGRAEFDNETTRKMVFESGRWYAVRLRVTQESIQCWLDDREMFRLARGGHRFELAPEILPFKPFGIGAKGARIVLRKVRLRRLGTEPEPRAEAPKPGEWQGLFDGKNPVACHKQGSLVAAEGLDVRAVDEQLQFGGDGGRLWTKDEFPVPLQIRTVAMTDSTNLRLYYCECRLIFNWELNQTELRFHCPPGDYGIAVEGKGKIPVREWVEVLWTFTRDRATIAVNGEERASVSRDFSGLRGPVGIGPAAGCTLTLKELSISGPKGKPPAKAGQWQSLFDGKTLDGWDIIESGDYKKHGQVAARQGVLSLGAGNQRTGVALTAPFPTDNYEVSLDARPVEGELDFAAVTFPLGTTAATLIVGGPDGHSVWIDVCRPVGGGENPTKSLVRLQNGRWYAVRLRVTPERVQAWVDDRKVIDVTREGHAFGLSGFFAGSAPFGLSTVMTKGEFRNVQVRKLGE